ncbi:hypothetical protein ACT3S7_12190 [Corynebacterium sp. AOP34-AQ2-28]|uniref:hypothetical protein n=1 Tax=Corynebacterium sp. AOP34-AQ2-28 TaxID=3457689 RepID=UPI004033D9D1
MTLTAGLLATSLVACDGDEADTTSGTTPQSESTGDNVASTEDQNAEVFELYNEALDNLDASRFTSDDVTLYDGTGAFQYTVTDVNGDDLPELLVSAVGETFSNAKVFTVDAAGLVETDQLYADGAATGGGGRAEFHTSAGHDGVFKTLGRSGSGEYTTSKWALEGDEMVEGQSWEYRSDRKPADLAEQQVEVEWTPVDDRSLLGGDATQDTEDQADGPNPDRPTLPEDDADEGPADAGGSLPQDDFALPEQTGTTCGTVDGVRVVAGSATSCGFAMNVAQEALQPGSWGPGVAPDATVTTPWGSTTVTASSPTTWETYTLDCTSGTDHARASCTGGNNAEVRFEKDAQGGLMYLLG